MTDFTTLARPYASAVYKLAVEDAALDSWGDALSLMAAVASDADMAHVLDNPSLSREQKGKIFNEVLGDRIDRKQKNMISLMADNGRLKLLPEVNAQFESLRAQAEGKVDAQVISAYALSAEQEKVITSALKNKLGRDVTITASTDKSLIGGVIIKAGDTIIDGSMKSQLEALTTVLNR